MRLFQTAFSESTPVSAAHLACTYGALYFILREFRYLQNPICQRLDFNEAISLADNKFDALLKDYNVLSVPSFGNVLALTLGVSCLYQSVYHTVYLNQCSLFLRNMIGHESTEPREPIPQLYPDICSRQPLPESGIQS